MKVTRRQLRYYLSRMLNESNTSDPGNFLLGHTAGVISVPNMDGESQGKNGKFIINISGYGAVTNDSFINTLAAGLAGSGGEGNIGAFGEQFLLTLKPFLGDFNHIEDTNKWVAFNEQLFGSPTGAGDSFGIDVFAYTGTSRFTGKTPTDGVLDLSDLGVGISMKFSTRVGGGSYSKQKSTMHNNEGMVKLACLYGLHWLFENNHFPSGPPNSLKDPKEWVNETIAQLDNQGVTSIKIKVDAINAAPRPQDPLVNQDITLDSGRASLKPPPTANFYSSLKEMLANAEQTYGQSPETIRINATDGSDLNQPLNLTIPAAAQNNINAFNANFLNGDIFKTKLGVIVVGDMIARMTKQTAGHYSAGCRQILGMPPGKKFGTSKARSVRAVNGKTMNSKLVKDYIDALMPRIQRVFKLGNRASEHNPVISLVSTSPLGTALGKVATINLSARTSNPSGVGSIPELNDPQNAKIEFILPSYKELNLEFSGFVTSAGASAVQQMRSTSGNVPASFQQKPIDAAYDASDVLEFDPDLVNLSQPVQGNLHDALNALSTSALRINNDTIQDVVDRALLQPGAAIPARQNAIREMGVTATTQALRLKEGCELLRRNLIPLADSESGIGPTSATTAIHYNQSKSNTYLELIKLAQALLKFNPDADTLTGRNSIDARLSTRIGKLMKAIKAPSIYKDDSDRKIPGLTHQVIDKAIIAINNASSVFRSLDLIEAGSKLSELSDAFAVLKTIQKIQVSGANPLQIYMLAEDLNKLSDILKISKNSEEFLAGNIIKAEVIALNIVNQIIQTISLFEIVVKIESAFTPTRITVSPGILEDLADYIDLINTELASENDVSNNVIDISFGQEERTADALNTNSNKPILQQTADASSLFESILKDILKYTK